MAHRIRLGPPWVVTPADDGRTRRARHFGRPRTLDPGECVWLMCGSLPAGSDVRVNGDSVGATDGEHFAADITHLLKPRNELVIHATTPDPLGEVALEIRPTTHQTG